MTKTKEVKKSSKKTKPKISLIPTTINTEQLMLMVQRTPAEHIHTKTGRGGRYQYVTGAYIRQVLNYIFGWMWDFEVKSHGKEGRHIWVLGKLIIKDKNGNIKIVKEQFGRADIKYKKGEKNAMDFGNDLKAAATDSMKKCASLLGIASDVYNANEFNLIQKSDKGFVPPQNNNIIPAKAEVVDPQNDKIIELKKMLDGETDKQKLADLKKKLGIILPSFRITQTHSKILIASMLNAKISTKK